MFSHNKYPLPFSFSMIFHHPLPSCIPPEEAALPALLPVRLRKIYRIKHFRKVLLSCDKAGTHLSHPPGRFSCRLYILLCSHLHDTDLMQWFLPLYNDVILLSICLQKPAGTYLHSFLPERFEMYCRCIRCNQMPQKVLYENILKTRTVIPFEMCLTLLVFFVYWQEANNNVHLPNKSDLLLTTPVSQEVYL